MRAIRNHVSKTKPKSLLSGAISTLRDQAQFFLRSVQRFELLLDRIPVPIMELDGKARILRTNEECAEMLNGSGTPLSGKSLFNFVAPSDTKRLQEYLAIARQTNKPCIVHTALVHEDKVCPVELRVRRQLIGNEIGYLAVVDGADEWEYAKVVTDRKRVDGAPTIDQLVLDLSRAHTLKSMGDAIATYCGKHFHSPAGLIFIRRDADLQLVSQWPPRLSSDQHIVKKISEKGPLARALTSGEPVFWHRQRAPYSSIGLYFHRLLRQFHAQHITFLPLIVPGDRAMGVIAIVLPPAKEFGPVLYDHLALFGHVVSGCIFRALAHHEAVGARERAENTAKDKDEFLSVLSHELKNPMMPILGWAVALSSRTLPADKQNLAIEGIIRSVRALNYLIEDLFDSMRISAGKFRLEFGETRIQDVAREALTAIQHAIESKKLRVSTEISEAIPPFMADPRRLHQVLVNLLNNAVKFTPEGGAIALQIRRRDHTVECIVSDNGRGIERTFLPFVFEKFRQSKRISKIQSAGLGLGLALVREIVELHGGSVEVLSKGAGKGSTFTVRLPMRKRNGRNGTVASKSA